MSETTFEKLVRALTTPMQDAEDTCQQMISGGMSVTGAVGAQLDLVGALVGRKRQGTTDNEIYRRQIRAQITANKSDGLVEDLITIADLVVFDDDATYVINNTGIAALELEIAGIVADLDVIDVLMPLIRLAAAGGVRVVVEFSTDTPANTFTLGDSSDAGVGTPLGDSTTPRTDDALPWAME